MSLIEWNNDLSVGVSEIDDQHKKLIDLINKLHDAMRERKGNDVIGNVINDLMAYVNTHFRNEEKYMIQFNYPAYATHLSEHKAFVAKVVDFKQKFDAKTAMLSMEIMDFLKNWLVNHIQGTDKKYTKCFLDNGLK